MFCLSAFQWDVYSYQITSCSNWQVILGLQCFLLLINFHPGPPKQKKKRKKEPLLSFAGWCWTRGWEMQAPIPVVPRSPHSLSLAYLTLRSMRTVWRRKKGAGGRPWSALGGRAKTGRQTNLFKGIFRSITTLNKESERHHELIISRLFLNCL